MGAELSFSEEAFEVGAEQLVGYPIASSDRWDAASDVIRVAAPLIVAAELARISECVRASVHQRPGGASYTAAEREALTIAAQLVERASELRGEA